MDGVVFRNASFGGFNREDVIQYIERTTKEHREALAEMQAEAEFAQERADELNVLNNELRNQLDGMQEQVREQLVPLRAEMERLLNENTAVAKENMELAGVNAQLEERLAMMQQKLEELEEQNSAAASRAAQDCAEAEAKAAAAIKGISEQCEKLERDNSALNAQTEQLRDVLNRRAESLKQAGAELEAKDEEIAQLRSQLAECEADSRNYHIICGRLGQIEAEMQSRSILAEEESQHKADAIIAEANDYAEEKRAAANAYYSSVVNAANEDAAELCQQVEEHLEQVRSNAIVTSEDMNRCVADTLADVSHIQTMLQQLSGRLGQHVDALFGIDVRAGLPIGETEYAADSEEAAVTE